jgi:hypothetical protein
MKFDILSNVCEYLGVIPNPLSLKNEKVLVIDLTSTYVLHDPKLQNSWQIVKDKNSIFTLLRDNKILLKDHFLERILDLFPTNNIDSVVWINDEERVYEHRLLSEKLEKRLPDLNKLLYLEVYKKSTIEIEVKFEDKIQIIEDTFGTRSLSGCILERHQIEFDFKDNLFYGTNFSNTYEVAFEHIYFVLWGDTKIGLTQEMSQIKNSTERGVFNVKELPEQTDLLRMLSAKDFEIFDLRNQLRAISTLTEVREDNTEGMKFRLKKESNLNRLLKTPNNGTRKIYNLLPGKFQLSLRILRNKYLRNR